MTRKKIEEAGVRREALIKEIAKFLERVLPKHTSPLQKQQQLPITEKEPLETSVQTPPPRRLEEEETVAVLPSISSSSPSGDIAFETPKKKRS